MFVLETFALGSLLFAGGRLAFRRKSAQTESSQVHKQTVLDATDEPKQSQHALTQARAKRDLRTSQVALGLAVAGAALRMPVIGLASLPVMLLVFAPVYGGAWRALRARRVDAQVLDATRVSVCVVMGYTVIAALNALLHASSQRLFLRSEEELRSTLHESMGLNERLACVECGGIEVQTPLDQIKPSMLLALRGGDTVPVDGVVVSGSAWFALRFAEDRVAEAKLGDRIAAGSRILDGAVSLRVEAVPETAVTLYGQLQEAPLKQTLLSRIGEDTGGRMAPWMIAAFALSTPIMGVNRAAAFLTTSFGAQMNRLSPYTARQFIGFASHHGILIREPRALELANRVDMIIFDARVLDHPSARPHAAGLIHALGLMPQSSTDASTLPFGIFVMATSEDQGHRLADDLGLDGYFIEAEGGRRAALVEGFQLGGRTVCYVGTGVRDAAAMNTALLSVDVREPSDLSETQAHIVLLDPRLRGLPGVFDLAKLFTAKQSFNLLAPIGVDLIDISTTVFLHFGLVYSVLLSYTGLLSSVAQAKMPKRPPIALPKAPSPPNPSEEEPRRIT